VNACRCTRAVVAWAQPCMVHVHQARVRFVGSMLHFRYKGGFIQVSGSPLCLDVAHARQPDAGIGHDSC